MEKKRFRKAFLVILSVSAFLYCGCVTSTVRPSWSEPPLDGSEYTVLGQVQLVSNWYGILGMPLFNLFGVSTPRKIGLDLYLVQWGGITYSGLLNAARRQFPGTDAVVDVIIDYKDSNSLSSIIFLKREITVTGIAIRYNRQ